MALSSAPSDVVWMATSPVVGMVQEELLGDTTGETAERGRNKKERGKGSKAPPPLRAIYLMEADLLE